MDDRIRKRLLNLAEELRSEAAPGLTGVDFERPEDGVLLNDIEHYPHAFVIGCVMDRQVKAERAWGIPARIRERVGSFEFQDLVSLRSSELTAAFQKPKAIHRYPKTMARLCHSAIQRIQEEWNGDARSIWAGDIGSATLVRRFLSFDGIGPKIATMAANILVRDFRIVLSDLHYIDISVDVHVKRVFRRLELVPKRALNFEVVYAAREMNPAYPGVFDFVCWEIGRSWCRPGKPNCPGCPMNDTCPGVSRFHTKDRGT